MISPATLCLSVTQLRLPPRISPICRYLAVLLIRSRLLRNTICGMTWASRLAITFVSGFVHINCMDKSDMSEAVCSVI